MQRAHDPSLFYAAYAMPTGGEAVEYDGCFLPSNESDWVVCDAEDDRKIVVMDEKTFWKYYDWSHQVSQIETEPELQAELAPFDPDSFDYEKDYVLETMIPCECGAHALSARVEGAIKGELQLSFWQYGHNANKKSWATRWKTIWDILTKGHSYSDMVILNQDEQQKLVDVINKADELAQKYDVDLQRYRAHQQATSKPRAVFTLQEVAVMQADHDAERRDLLEVIEKLTAQIKPNP